MATEHVSFDLTLNKEIKGSTDLSNPVCAFHYDWDKEKNMGIAMLRSINGSEVNITLHPLGISGQLDFMSDMAPTTFSMNASNDDSIAVIQVTIYRVILDTEGDKRSAAIMIGEDGGTIIASEGFMDASASKELPKVEFERPQA